MADEPNYDWDEDKSERTRANRGFGFGFGFGFEIMPGFLWDYALCVEIQSHDGEEREKWIGPIGDYLYTIIVMQRPEALRLITMWRADQTEIRLWRQEFER